MSQYWCFASIYADDLDVIGVIIADTIEQAGEKLYQASYNSKHPSYGCLQRIYEDYKFNFHDHPNFHLPQNGSEFLHMIDKLNDDVDSTKYSIDRCDLI